MNDTPPPGRDPHADRYTQLADIVCEQDRGESPFGWSDPTADHKPDRGPLPYGSDPWRYDAPPAALIAAIVAQLAAKGWTARPAGHDLVIPLDANATGLPEQVAAGEELHLHWGLDWSEWSWRTAPPGTRPTGPVGVIFAAGDDPYRISAEVDRVLRAGSSMP